MVYFNTIPTGHGDPIRIAVDSAGLLYVTTPVTGKVAVLSQDGALLRTIGGFKKPMSVAVDSLNRAYVGDYGDGSVTVVGTNGQRLLSLGKGAGEFALPGDIAIGPNGFAYVTDSPNNIIKVYNQDGIFQFAFGDSPALPGQVSFPTGIASDAVNQEIYVVNHNAGQVTVYDLNGTFKRKFAALGGGPGRLTRAQGIAVSGGFVYVVDAYQSAIEIFDTLGNYVNFVGQYGKGPGDLKVPMDVAVSGAKVFVTDTDNERVEVFLDKNAVTLDLTPSALVFSTPVTSPAPNQPINVVSSVPASPLAWTATASSTFIRVNQTSGTTPSAVSVGVDVASLAPGSYSGTVSFVSSGGQTASLFVSLTVQGEPVPGGSGGGGTSPVPGVWTQISGATLSPPALGWNPVTQEMQVAVRGLDDAIWISSFGPNGDFNNDWQSLPAGRTPDAPALAWNPAAQKMQVVVLGMDYSVWGASFDPTGNFNNDWASLGSSSLSAPALAWNAAAQKMQLVVSGTDHNSIYASTFGPTGSFNYDWIYVAGATPSAPALAWNPVLQVMQVAIREARGAFKRVNDPLDLGTFGVTAAFNNDWTFVTGSTDDSPALAWDAAAQETAMFVRANDDSLWYASFNSSGAFNWNWTAVPGSSSSAPAMAWHAGINMLQIVVRAANGSLWSMFY